LVAVVGALAALSSIFLFGATAQAQTNGYPPGTSVPTCVAGNVNAGNLVVGQTVTFTLCGNFAAGASITVNVNGVSHVFTKTAVNGAVVVVVTVVSSTVLAVGDPVNVAATCGTNTVVATGAAASGETTSVTGTFNLVCTSTTTTGNGLALTGTNAVIGILTAVGLIIVGALLVVFQRRRRQTI
jgi:hypothetical protein